MTPALQRDRRIVLAGIIGICLLSWLYLLHLAANMGPGTAMSPAPAWETTELLFLFFMWAIMMVAMMIPSASPMILLFTDTRRMRREGADALGPAVLFTLGYVTVWTGFSAAAALAQWSLHALALISPAMKSTSTKLGGGILLAAGAFQWTSLKYRCLSRCRSPLSFLLNEWREGQWGAFLMGLRHGLFCLGCCWALMGLLFVTGVMNLLWVAIIALFVLVEKVAPAGKWVSRIGGGLMVGWGLWMLVS